MGAGLKAILASQRVPADLSITHDDMQVLWQPGSSAPPTLLSALLPDENRPTDTSAHQQTERPACACQALVRELDYVLSFCKLRRAACKVSSTSF
jgi:hypothetical protein